MRLKKYFLTFRFMILPNKDFRDPLKSENVFVFKVPLAGTLNLCLRLPDHMQKTKINPFILGKVNA